MRISVKVDEARRAPISLDFGLCELEINERKRRKSSFALNFCLFFASAVVLGTAKFLSK